MLRGEWVLKVNGKAVAKGKFPTLKTAPQQTEKLKLKLPALTGAPGDEAFLHVRFTTATPTTWSKAGHEVSQFIVNEYPKLSVRDRSKIRVIVNLWTDCGVRHAVSFTVSTDSGAQ